ncbi:MAG: signal peptidase II [Candidatus Marinimicrobia bacterium]|nr:signal peptidase II [Candidatus Neomarinimicrobiota bacterium]MCF7828349.1 signal peptidase II [Candidatus Neomarinimicrobiota bacterium]MCF7881058.1 signal peptidase II [Candidatus Neomarinimicrobiota bacterium]
MKNALKDSRFPILIGFFLIGLDFFTKWIANIALPVQQTIHTSISFWKWHLTYNRGYHYIFGEIGNFRLVQSLGLIAVLILIGLMVKNRAELPKNDVNRHLFAGYIALLMGATGNPWETVVLGRVTDFFVFTPLPWPSNLADQYINIAIYVLLPIWLVISFRDWRRERQAKQADDSEYQTDSYKSP